MENNLISMKLLISVCGKDISVSAVPEGSKARGLNLDVKTDNIRKVADIVLSYMYDEHAPFREGFCRVRKGDLYGFVDLELQEVVAPEYSFARDVSEGFAVVRKDGKYVFLDMSSRREMLWDNYLFDEADDVKGGLARVKKDGKYGYFSADEWWNAAIPCEYDDVQRNWQYSPIIAVKKDGKWGILGKDGSVIIEPTFDSIRFIGKYCEAYLGNNKFNVENDGTYHEVESN